MSDLANRSMEYLLVPQKEVTDYLKMGWQLYGSPVCQSSLIWQAMTKVTGQPVSDVGADDD